MRRNSAQELRQKSRQLTCRSLRKICKTLITGIIASIACVEYITAIRTFIRSHHGEYWTGLIDGAIIITIIIATSLYLYTLLIETPHNTSNHPQES